MRFTTTLVFAIGAVALAGCARKQLPPPPPTEGYSAPAAAPSTAEGSERATSALQADLAAAAGSDRVLFEVDSSDLSESAKQILMRQAVWLRGHASIAFTIEGHCDERGTREYNLALGDRRAKAAASFLILQGIAPERLRTISYGKERPEALGSDEAAYSQNRRAVSIVVQP